MFVPERWASAFVRAVGEGQEALEEGLAALKVLLPCIQKIPGVVSGNTSANRIERMIRQSMEKTGASGRGIEYACRLLVLLVRKGLGTRRNGAALLEGIETLRDRKNGVLIVRVDSAFPLDREFQETLQETVKQGIGRALGAKEIRLIPQIVPELLGGYRLRIGSESVDASLRLLIQKMAAHLQGTGAAEGVAW
ncbi:MAG: F0F1 ATP synthase subunit delta [Treponema sp.]|jgi:F-type H+-transporting ATPase subunit delta|nr:F0F1 ATP synthase subunit delta [Treponema sp.]